MSCTTAEEDAGLTDCHRRYRTAVDGALSDCRTHSSSNGSSSSSSGKEARGDEIHASWLSLPAWLYILLTPTERSTLIAPLSPRVSRRTEIDRRLRKQRGSSARGKLSFQTAALIVSGSCSATPCRRRPLRPAMMHGVDPRPYTIASYQTPYKMHGDTTNLRYTSFPSSTSARLASSPSRGASGWTWAYTEYLKSGLETSVRSSKA